MASSEQDGLHAQTVEARQDLDDDLLRHTAALAMAVGIGFLAVVEKQVHRGNEVPEMG